MTCRARYRGLNPVFGVSKRNIYTLQIGSQACVDGDPYMWVHIDELPAYLMPYESIVALVTDWDFAVEEKAAYVDHLALMDKWLDVYTPAEVIA